MAAGSAPIAHAVDAEIAAAPDAVRVAMGKAVVAPASETVSMATLAPASGEGMGGEGGGGLGGGEGGGGDGGGGEGGGGDGGKTEGMATSPSPSARPRRHRSPPHRHRSPSPSSPSPLLARARDSPPSPRALAPLARDGMPVVTVMEGQGGEPLAFRVHLPNGFPGTPPEEDSYLPRRPFPGAPPDEADISPPPGVQRPARAWSCASAQPPTWNSHGNNGDSTGHPVGTKPSQPLRVSDV